MNPIADLCARIAEPDLEASREASRRLDDKTKPLGSLGRLEELSCRIAGMRRTPAPPALEKAIVVMAADHGVAAVGVSAYPQEVTRQMLCNFAAGGAAINVLARHASASLFVVDMGTRNPELLDERARRVILNASIDASGTKNFVNEAAMTREQALTAIERGASLGEKLADSGFSLFGLGEMGIGNTTSASAITSLLCGARPADVTGSGTGIGARARLVKIEAIEKAIQRQRPRADDPLDVLHKVGGFEIAGLVGLCLAGAARQCAIVLDGFITSAAALVAARIEPKAAHYFIAAHRSREPGHAHLLEQLRLRPLLELDLCLGEGTGAALALPIIDASLKALHEMASFESAGVSR